MAISLKHTSDAAQIFIKLLVYGHAGAGKTSLIPTLPNPVVLSAEGGLLSIAKSNLPYIEIRTMADLREAYGWVTGSDEAKQFESVALDSISEIAEVVLTTEKRTSKDARLAYTAMQDTMQEMIRSFRDIPSKHVFMSAKLEKAQDEQGKLLYSPSMPGNKMGQMLPYFFDEVLALRVERDDQSKVRRVLQCDSDGSWLAKDRSGVLGMWQKPDLGHLIKLMRGQS